MATINAIRKHFIDELAAGNFTVSRDGSKTIELLGASFVADEPAIFGEPNATYIEREINWYNSCSLNVNDLMDPVPAAWKATANECGEVNSNYGNLVFSVANGDQYANALAELTTNRDTRRASMVYQRPSIWLDATADGKNDFICTNAVTYYVRDGKLNCVVQMRSNDVIFGYRNDFAWQQYLLRELTNDYTYCSREQVTPGTIYWQVQNLHVYERHFHLVK